MLPEWSERVRAPDVNGVEDSVASAKIGCGELAGAGAKGRARGEGARAHPEAWAERWRNVAEHVAAAGTAAVIADGAGGVGAQPVTTGVAGWIDALNGEAGQVLHSIFPQEASLLASR